MAVRSVIEIDVNDERFKPFVSLYQQYAAMVEKVAATNKAAGQQQVANNAKDEEKQKHNLLNQRTRNREDEKNELTWRNIAKWSSTTTANAQRFVSIAKGFGMGLLGFGGMTWGLDRLGASFGAERKNAKSLGLAAPSEINAFSNTYGRFVSDPNSFLQNVATAKGDFRTQLAFNQLGIGAGEKNSLNEVQLAQRLIPALHEKLQGVDDSRLETDPTLEIFRQQLKLTTEDFRLLKHASDEELRAQVAKYAQRERDNRQTDAQFEAWQSFTEKINSAASSVEHRFGAAIVKLVPDIGRLADTFKDAVDKFLDSETFAKWVHAAEQGLHDFVDLLNDPTFQHDVEVFFKSLAQLAEGLAKTVVWLAAKLPGLLGATPPGAEGRPSESPEQTARRTNMEAQLRLMETRHNDTHDAANPDEAAYRKALKLQYLDEFQEQVSWKKSNGFSGELRNMGLVPERIPDYTPPPTGLVKSSAITNEETLALIKRLEGSGQFAISPKGAMGNYQIMPKTAEGLGRDPNKQFDAEYNKETASMLLGQLEKQYKNNLAEVLVAYNAGTKTADKFRDRGDDWSVLPAETQKYLARALGSSGQNVRVTIISEPGSNVTSAGNAVVSPASVSPVPGSN